MKVSDNKAGQEQKSNVVSFQDKKRQRDNLKIIELIRARAAQIKWT